MKDSESKISRTRMRIPTDPHHMARLAPHIPFGKSP